MLPFTDHDISDISSEASTITQSEDLFGDWGDGWDEVDFLQSADRPVKAAAHIHSYDAEGYKAPSWQQSGKQRKTRKGNNYAFPVDAYTRRNAKPLDEAALKHHLSFPNHCFDAGLLYGPRASPGSIVIERPLWTGIRRLTPRTPAVHPSPTANPDNIERGKLTAAYALAEQAEPGILVCSIATATMTRMQLGDPGIGVYFGPQSPLNSYCCPPGWSGPDPGKGRKALLLAATEALRMARNELEPGGYGRGSKRGLVIQVADEMWMKWMMSILHKLEGEGNEENKYTGEEGSKQFLEKREMKLGDDEMKRYWLAFISQLREVEEMNCRVGFWLVNADDVGGADAMAWEALMDDMRARAEEGRRLGRWKCAA